MSPDVRGEGGDRPLTAAIIKAQTAARTQRRPERARPRRQDAPDPRRASR
jgi:hypothetical protein